MVFSLNFTAYERRQIAAALVVEILLGDGFYVCGNRTAADGLTSLGVGPMLVPPDEAEGSRWFDPGPKYPDKYIKAADLVRPELLDGLKAWGETVLAQGVDFLVAELPENIAFEQTGRKPAKVLSRDGKPVPFYEAGYRAHDPSMQRYAATAFRNEDSNATPDSVAPTSRQPRMAIRRHKRRRAGR